MSVSVVIPVKGRAPLTRQCLAWLGRELGGRAGIQIVVVDDGSEDVTPRMLAEQPGIVVVRHERSRGFAASCNAGAAAARGEQLVFLNNDVVAVAGWLDALVADAVPGDVGAVGAKLLYSNDTVQHAGIVICGDGRPRHAYRGFGRSHPAVSRSRDMAAVTAACVLVPRGVFEDAGGFDESFVNGFEDVDLCLRIRERGLRVRYCAASELYHLESATRRIASGQERRDHEANEARFLGRWAGRLPADELTTYEADGLLRVTHSDVYPLELAFAPELASAAPADASELADLLTIRSRQVFDLLKENMALRMRLGDLSFEAPPAELAGLARSVDAFAPRGEPGDAT